MKYRHVFWAIIMIALGLIILIGNLGLINFHWSTLWQLWPLILIIWGISILPVRDTLKFVFLGIVIVFTILFFNRITEPRFWFQWHDRDWSWHDDDRPKGDPGNMETQTLSVPYDSLSAKAELKLEAAAGNFEIEGMTSDMLSFYKEGDIGNYALTTEDERGRKVIRLQLESSTRPRNFSKNKVKINLTDRQAWDLDFDIGAAAMKMDLKEYKIDTMEIDAGASSIELTLGDKNPFVYLSFNAGASSINIRIPEASACEIRSESFLVSRDFPGFKKKGSGLYRSDNFDEGKNKISINLESAISSISIDRY